MSTSNSKLVETAKTVTIYSQMPNTQPPLSRLISSACCLFVALLLATTQLPTNLAAKKTNLKKSQETAQQQNISLGEQAYEAFEEGKYITALKLAERAIANNEPNAYTLLGRLYAGGLGIPKDMKKAATYYEQGAKLGDVHSLVALGGQYAAGNGVEKNYTKAANLFEKAAKKGEPMAQYNLALIYANGDGRRIDLYETAKWMQKAADNDLAVAQYALGTLYALGRGVQKDEEKAAIWTGKAARSGNSEAELEYAIMLFKGRGIEKDIKLAFHYFRSSAVKGNPVAQNRLARLYAYGIAVEPNPIEAAKWHLISRDQGITDMKLDLFVANLPKDMRQKAEAAINELKGTNGLY